MLVTLEVGPQTPARETANESGTARGTASGSDITASQEVTQEDTSHLGFYRNSSWCGKAFLIYRWTFSICELITTIVVLGLYSNQDCSKLFVSTLWIYLVLNTVVLISVPRYYILMFYSEDDDDPVVELQENKRKGTVQYLDTLFFVPFLLGNLALFHSTGCDPHFSELYIYMVVVVSIEYVYLFSPIVAVIIAAALSPFIFLVYIVHTLLEDVQFRWENGASEELIGTIPIVTYVRKRFSESLSLNANPQMDLEAPPPSASRRFELFSRKGMQQTGKEKYLHVADEDANCTVCLEPYSMEDSLKQLDCKHHFHAKCIDDWLKRNAKCPLCIRPIKGKKPKSGAK